MTSCILFLLYAAAVHLCSCSSKPNVLFILADDYGFNDIGYHNPLMKTPTLDALARNGVILENYYVQPICTPTRSQLMSGRYQIHTGLQHQIIWPSQPNALPRNSPTLADKMHDTGYATHAVGKWHLGFYKEEHLPTNRGFDTFYGYLGGSEDYYTHHTCDYYHNDTSMGRYFASGDKWPWCGLDLRDETTPVFNENEHYSAFIYTQKAVDIIAKHDQNQPLFLYLAYQSVHGPLQVPDKYTRQYDFIQDKDRRTYAGMVTCMDEGIGNITSALKKAGMWDNTLIVFSTDNGGQIHAGGNNWPLRGWKASLWEGGFHGVGFVHGTMLQNSGTVNRHLIHVSDWYPTILSLVGGSLNGTQPLDGFDQWKAISEGGPSRRQELLHNIDILYPKRGSRLYADTFDTRVRAAIRVADWKLITGDPGNGSWIAPPRLSHLSESDTYDHDENVWLFNITSDPQERHNLAHDHPDVVRAFLDRLAYYNSTAVPPVYPPSDPKCNPSLHGGVWGPWE